MGNNYFRTEKPSLELSLCHSLSVLHKDSFVKQETKTIWGKEQHSSADIFPTPWL